MPRGVRGGEIPLLDFFRVGMAEVPVGKKPERAEKNRNAKSACAEWIGTQRWRAATGNGAQRLRTATPNGVAWERGASGSVAKGFVGAGGDAPGKSSEVWAETPLIRSMINGGAYQIEPQRTEIGQ